MASWRGGGDEEGIVADETGATAFEALVADLDYPMFVVTAAAGGRRAGCMAGAPVLEAGHGWIAGDVLERVPFGDHGGFVVEPFAGHVADAGAAQLGFQAVRDLQPGHRA